MEITDEQIVEAIKNTSTMSAAAALINMPFMTFRYRAKKLNVYRPNQSRKGIARSSDEYVSITIPLKEILSGLHPTYQTNNLKRRLIKEGIKEERCEGESCNITNVWNGKKLVLHLDHIDGNSNNHKLNNLRLLCPNCHSQTETFSGKSSKKNKK